MIIWFIRYIRGYLDVRFSGVYSEKILSNLARDKVSVWRLRYHYGTIYGKMYAKDFHKLRKLKKNTGVSIHIDKKRGFPFFARRYSKRAGFIIGIAVFFAVLNFLSGFVWIINVQGNDTVNSSEILKSLNGIGIHEEMRKSGIDAKNMAQKLILARDDLAWASLNIEGCVLNVNVTEIKEKSGGDKNTPTNLIADKDGIIRKIDAVSGDVRVKVGESVHKGDILVSGIIENMSGTVFVCSNAEIIAQVEEVYTEKMSFLQKTKIKTGSRRKQTAVDILGVKLLLYLPKAAPEGETSFKVTQKKLFGKRIPFTVYEKTTEYTKEKRTVYGEEELKSILTKNLNEFLTNEKIHGYIQVGTEFISEDDGVTVRHRYLCDINIAKESKILVGQ